MTLEEYIVKYKKLGKREKTKCFNELNVAERKAFLNILSDENRKAFIDTIRQQAIADFWTHERELIQQGKSTRNWTPQQIEDIMHISEKSGKVLTDGTVAYDVTGKAYYGHHMLNVADHLEYAGDYRNIQALDYKEHYEGAHKNHQTAVPTDGYYDFDTGKTEPVIIPEWIPDSENFKINYGQICLMCCTSRKNVYNVIWANSWKREDAKLEV